MMKIDEMPAGPELNELLATALDLWVYPNPVEQAGDEEHWPSRRAPLFSTKIDAAWVIVEKLKKSGTQRLTIGIGGHAYKFTCAYRGKKAEAIADTAPLAICRAAFMAVEKASKGRIPDEGVAASS